MSGITHSQAHGLHPVGFFVDVPFLQIQIVREYFILLAPHIKCVHLRDLYADYPHREMFSLLRAIGYKRYTLAEVPDTKDPLRVMRYYRALWEQLSAYPKLPQCLL